MLFRSEALDDRDCTRQARAAERGEFILHRLDIANVKSQEVDLVPTIDRREFDAGDDPKPMRLRGALCCTDPRQRVMVGQRDRHESRAVCGGDEILG